jgi:hypothetical protein
VIAKLRAALAATRERDILVYTPFIELVLGRLVGGDEGAKLVDSGTAMARTQGWVKPELGVELVLPASL